MFGADALARKFGKQPPAEWDGALSYLSDIQLCHGLETVMRGGSEHMPSLPAFLASCRNAREWQREEPVAIAGPSLDKWGIVANSHLLAYVIVKMGEKRCFDPDETRLLVQAKNAWAEDMRADDRGEGIDVSLQKAAWADCIARAEQRMFQRIAA